jgi:hypothetical protein
MIDSRRKFLKTLAVGIIGGELVSALPITSFAKNFDKGIEIQKGYIVFNENTQKVMEALAEALVPGSREINIKEKVMSYVDKRRGAATFFDAGLWNLDSQSNSRYKKHFYNLKNKENVDTLLNNVKIKNPMFFNQFRYLIVRLYYSDPAAWKKLSYNGPPQPKGFMDYSEPPKQVK